jgi:acetyl esterase/lipase
MIPQTQIAFLVNKGFVVVTPEYRLCPQVNLYEGPVQDAKDVYHWCREDLGTMLNKEGLKCNVDEEKIVVMGHSAGGMLALTTVRPPTLCTNPKIGSLTVT